MAIISATTAITAKNSTEQEAILDRPWSVRIAENGLFLRLGCGYGAVSEDDFAAGEIQQRYQNREWDQRQQIGVREKISPRKFVERIVELRECRRGGDERDDDTRDCAACDVA